MIRVMQVLWVLQAMCRLTAKDVQAHRSLQVLHLEVRPLPLLLQHGFCHRNQACLGTSGAKQVDSPAVMTGTANAGPVKQAKGGADNRWLLSRSIPIDVRLLIAALTSGGGALTYWWFEKVGVSRAAVSQDSRQARIGESAAFCCSSEFEKGIG